MKKRMLTSCALALALLLFSGSFQAANAHDRFPDKRFSDRDRYPERRGQRPFIVVYTGRIERMPPGQRKKIYGYGYECRPKHHGCESHHKHRMYRKHHRGYHIE